MLLYLPLYIHPSFLGYDTSWVEEAIFKLCLPLLLSLKLTDHGILIIYIVIMQCVVIFQLVLDALQLEL